MPLSGHSSEENPLLAAESQEKKPPQDRPLPPNPQIGKDSQKMEENSEHNVTCLGVLLSETQNPNFQTLDNGGRGSILGGQDIPLDVEINTDLIAVWQETEKEPGLLPSRGSMGEPEAETKPVLSALGVGVSPGRELPNIRELPPTPKLEATPPRPPKPSKETNESSINSQEIEEDYEIDLKRLVRDEVLGEGEFGIVYKGRYHCKNNKAIDVAVKQLKGMYVDSEFIPCLLTFPRQLRHHGNLAYLIANLTKLSREGGKTKRAEEKACNWLMMVSSHFPNLVKIGSNADFLVTLSQLVLARTNF